MGASPEGFQARHLSRAVALFGALLLACLVLGVAVGPTTIDFGRVLGGDDVGRDLFKLTVVRLPRATAAVIVGGCLALAGVVFQALIHNPLASPYILGVSAGGSFGAVCAIAAGIGLVVPFALVGAMAAIVLVYLVARTEGRVPADTLLLAGVIVNTFFAACIMLTTYLTGSDQTLRIMRWLVGGLSDLYEWRTLLFSGLVLVTLGAGLTLDGRALNLLSVGDDTAERMGIDVQRVRTRLFFLASLTTAVAVSISGPIGFVGLIIPHILRLLVGSDHRLLVPCSALAGGAFLVVADTAASVLWRTPLPVGLVTALLGGPFFIWLMKTRNIKRAGHGL